ncbi:substrate-binding periplasmic protein [Kiloniella antarctica]|uniref:Substrate-binding periplasmic protein n=1 Tax=Kiloniella antarctica TaxID=1550907 RepID=A0ABW5BL37_9PROT
MPTKQYNHYRTYIISQFLDAFFLAIFGLIIISSVSIAADKVRYGISHWPPYALAEQAKLAGIDYDVSQELSKRLGIEFDYRVCPFKRCLQEMKSGQLDLLAGIARNPEREKYMAYTDTPYSTVAVVFYVRKGETSRLVTYEDLYKMRVGYVSKSHYFEPFNTDQKIPKVDVDKEHRLLRMLYSGRIDTYVGTDPNASYEIKTMGYKDKLEKAPFSPKEEVSIHFATSRKSKHVTLASKISEIIFDMHEDGTIKKIHAKYK